MHICLSFGDGMHLTTDCVHINSAVARQLIRLLFVMDCVWLIDSAATGAAMRLT